MKIGITGATGFIGRHLIRQLNERGQRLPSPSRVRPAKPRGAAAWKRATFRPDAAAGPRRASMPWSTSRARASSAGGPTAKRKVARPREPGRLDHGTAGRGDGERPPVRRACWSARRPSVSTATGATKRSTRAKRPGDGFPGGRVRDWEGGGAGRGAFRRADGALVRIGLVIGADGGAFPLLAAGVRARSGRTARARASSG